MRLLPLRGLAQLSRREVLPVARNHAHRTYATKPKPKIRVLNGDPDPALFEDHRKPWFFTINKLGNFVILPTVFLYAVFFYDFGDREHVFSPARRWLDEQKAAFFSLSPEERELAKAEADAKSENVDADTQTSTK